MNLYSTTALLGVLRSLRRPQKFLLDTYFKFEVNSDKEEIAFDVEGSDEGLAPFVAPTKEGKIILERGFKTKTFQPAYIKIKTPLTPLRALKRAIGETIGGLDLTAAQRQQLRIASTLVLHQDRIARRLEVMAAEVLREGKVTVAGEDYETTVVDYGRSAALRITLPNGETWADAGSDPIKNLEAWAQLVFDESGAVVRDVVMGSLAWSAFRDNEKVLKLLDVRRADGAGPINIGPAAPVIEGAVFMGTLGSFNLYQYNGSYKDDAGVRQRILPPNGVMGIDSATIGGIRYFGAIADEEANIVAQRDFVKSWLNPDPSQRLILTQTAPLVAPGRADTNYYAEVVELD